MDDKNNIKKTITATYLKNNLGMYLDYVSENNEVVVTKNGKKSVRLVPYITDYDSYLKLKETALEYELAGKKVSYEEFMEIYQKSELRMEYINGEIIVKASPTISHQDISGNLHMFLRNFLKGKKCRVYYSPFDVHFYKKDIKTPDVIQPDLLILCDIDENRTENDRYTGIPTLVIEILSKSSRSRDMVNKLNTYMLSGVKEYWIIDPVKQNILFYSFKEFEIDEFMIYEKDDILKSCCFNGLAVNVNEVFSY